MALADPISGLHLIEKVSIAFVITDYGFVNADDRSLAEVFKLFDVIHILTTDHATVTRITKEVRSVCSMPTFSILLIRIYCLCVYASKISESRLLKILR